MQKSIDTKELADFLGEANKSTYANKNAPRAASARLKSRDYHFEKGDLIYHDTYFGRRDFIGEEVVYKNQKPVWGANYVGFILDDNLDERENGDFLRKALMQEYDDIIPVRGPKYFKEGNFEYKNTASGGLERFEGREEIFKDGKLVYYAIFHGGFIR